MRHLARRLVRSHAIPYRIWLFARNGYKVKLPDRDTDLHVDGFQRSGNTFASLILRKIYREKRIVTNLHAVAALRQAQKFSVPTIALIRNPEQAILSSLVRRVDGEKESLSTALSFDLHGYRDYYSYVLQQQDSLEFVVFERMIKDPLHLVTAASRAFGEPVPADATIADAARFALEALDSDKREGGDRNLYSEYKEKQKHKYIAILDQDMLDECREIYQKIVALAGA